MSDPNPYDDFTNRFKLLISKRPDLIATTLGNIFTMRLIGNKTHGDLAEIAIAEFINQYMYDFRSEHVGKDLFRAKSQEEDIRVINEITQGEFPISLKAYGNGPLQLSTDKNAFMFPRLTQEGTEVIGAPDVQRVLDDPIFTEFRRTHVLPLIYDEKRFICNILVFGYARAMRETEQIVLEEGGRGRKHPVYRFYNGSGGYICEVRYGGAAANALQRGLWTHTRNAYDYFDSITNGWISYAHNPTLVQLFSHALVASQKGHRAALEAVQQDIEQLRIGSETFQ
jgi:hypothetical protein